MSTPSLYSRQAIGRFDDEAISLMKRVEMGTMGTPPSQIASGKTRPSQ
jgi:hypothetical protein